jgi:ParB-like chromosome segregation protein Spo0J
MTAQTTPKENGTEKLGSAPAVKDGMSPVKDGMTVIKLPLIKVFCDYGWNSRPESDVRLVLPEGGAIAGFDPESESTGMGGGGDKTEPGLVEAITIQGQLDPIEVRPNPDPATAKEMPYKITAGHKRYTALTLIAKAAVTRGDAHPIAADPTWDANAPTVYAIVKTMPEWQARERNIAENTERGNLPTPGLAWAIKDLQDQAKAAGVDLSNAQIAARIGKTESYVGTLLKIMKLPKKITKHWREGGKANFGGVEVVTTAPLPYLTMLALCAVDQDEVEKEYAGQLSVAGNADKKNRSPEQKKLDSACKAATSIGELLGFFAIEGIEPQRVKASDWEKVVVERVGFTRKDGKDPTATQLERLISSAKSGYEEEKKRLVAPKDGTGGADEEKNQAKRNKRDGGR